MRNFFYIIVSAVFVPLRSESINIQKYFVKVFDEIQLFCLRHKCDKSRDGKIRNFPIGRLVGKLIDAHKTMG